jgi:hypothetical protein
MICGVTDQSDGYNFVGATETVLQDRSSAPFSGAANLTNTWPPHGGSCGGCLNEITELRPSRAPATD